MNDDQARAVLLTGPVGSGKTALAMELGELLDARGLPAAIIDLDWLGWFQGPAGAPTPDELIAANLCDVWPRFRAAGARYLVMARALTTASAVRALKDALPGVEVTVALIGAPAEVIAERLGRREEGEVLRAHLEESSAMAEALEGAGLEDLRIENGAAPVGRAAEELLRRLEWG